MPPASLMACLTGGASGGVAEGDTMRQGREAAGWESASSPLALSHGGLTEAAACWCCSGVADEAEGLPGEPSEG